MTTHLRNRLFALVSASITLLILSGCAGVSTQDDRGSGLRISGGFPVPKEIEGNVSLWTNVYGRWSRGQVAFHDDRHMGIVYEVLDLPDWANGSDARDWVSGRQAELGARLGALEYKVAAGEALTPDEEALRNQIVSVAGPQAVFGARERLRSQRGMREKFRRGLEISGRYDSAFREIFRAEGLPEDLAYLPHVESSFQTNARSGARDGRWAFVALLVGHDDMVTTQMERGWVNSNGLAVLDLKEPGHCVLLLLDRLLEGATNPWGLAMSSDEWQLYVSLAGIHQVAIIDLPRMLELVARTTPVEAPRLSQDVEVLERLKIARRVDAGGIGPRGLALSEARGELLVANYFSDDVSVMDAATDEIKTRIPLAAKQELTLWRPGAGVRCLLIRSSEISDQLREMAEAGVALQLDPQRCTVCNGPLEETETSGE